MQDVRSGEERDSVRGADEHIKTERDESFVYIPFQTI